MTPKDSAQLPCKAPSELSWSRRALDQLKTRWARRELDAVFYIYLTASVTIFFFAGANLLQRHG